MGRDQTGHEMVADMKPARPIVIDENPDRRLFDTLDRTRSAGIDAMGAALSHELNQPLSAMLLYLQSLQKLCNRVTMPDPLMNELVGKALKETQRAVDIVRRMRRFSASSEPAREAVDINALARDSIESSLSSAIPRPTVVIELDPLLPTVQADPVQIRQVMTNLLKNACEATSRQTDARIVISTQCTGSIVQFNVRDNGPGIDPKIADRLFRAFETSKPNGMGLGLAISRMIAQNHYGDLVVELGETGGGAYFGLRLPIR